MRKNKTKVQPKIFKQLIKELKKYDLGSVAEISDVSLQTLNTWIGLYPDRTVTAPQMRTFIPVAEAIGYKLELVFKGASHLKSVA